MHFDPSSRNKLTRFTVDRFVGDTLFPTLGRVVSLAECLPRKELFEAWEVAKRVRRRTRGGRLIDMAAGHGLLAFIMLLLDRRIDSAVCVDQRQPPSFAKLQEALVAEWPRLEGRVTYIEGDLADPTVVPLTKTDLVVSVHACGALTDVVMDRARAARARVAVLPCCHVIKQLDTGGLEGWIRGPLAIDVMRAAKLAADGYSVWTGKIPEAITPKNRLLVGVPDEG